MAEDEFRVFLSHCSADKPAVETLAHILEGKGIRCWLDKWNLVPGEPWQPAIENALAGCPVCVVFFGPGGVGPWHNEEMLAAMRQRVQTRGERRMRVLPVILPGGRRVAETNLPPFLQGTTWVEFQKSLSEEDTLHRLECGIRGRAPGYSARDAPFVGRCPYVGLRTFTDANLFFGREALVEQLLDRWRRSFGSSREQRFLALVGASGSGKSSLASAGLLPALERGALPESDTWLVVKCRPGSDPWESLRVALASRPELAPHFSAVHGMAAAPDQEAHHLHLLARLALHGSSESRRLVVLVDQFEELFTLYRQDQDVDGRLSASRRRFIENLLYPSSIRDSPVHVVLTMRADFFGHCAFHSGFRTAISENQVLLGPMSPEELRAAIERPAQLCGCEVEAELVEHLLEDMERQPGALPFLQHALLKLWEGREGRRLTAAAYREMGSLEGALDVHSEAFFAGLPAEERALLRTVLLDLVQLGEGASDTKRRRPLDRLAHGQKAALHPFVAMLANAHLVVTDQAGGEVQVELSHEALLKGWRRFQGWIDESREEKRQKDRIEAAAKEWVEAAEAQKSDFLWRGSQLETAEFALEKSSLPLSEEGNRFLAAARELRALELAEKEAIAERERENDRRLREAETARLLAEARAEKERAEEIERHRAKEKQHARELADRAEALWAAYREEGAHKPDVWRVSQLAEMEGLLAEAVARDGSLAKPAEQLVGMRRLLVETAIGTQDLNLASIYLNKLKADPLSDSSSVPRLGAELEAAWTEADPARNPQVQNMIQWALRSSWLAPLGQMLLIGLGAALNFPGDLLAWMGIAVYITTVLHLVAALWAVMAITLDHRRVRSVYGISLFGVIVSLFGLNPISFICAAWLARKIDKLDMQKIVWSPRKS